MSMACLLEREKVKENRPEEDQRQIWFLEGF